MQILREEPGDLPLIIHMGDDGAFPSRRVYGEDIAGLGARAVAAAADVLILGIVVAVVTWIALQIAELPSTWEHVVRILGWPMVALYVGLAITYVAGLTCLSGQTLGKRLMRIRVVVDQADDVSLPRALVRAIGWLVSVGSLGLLCVPAIFDLTGRTPYDHLAGTHVVRMRN